MPNASFSTSDGRSTNVVHFFAIGANFRTNTAASDGFGTFFAPHGLNH
jgi:hypothetical protein